MITDKVTILIVNWNAGDYLLRCLESIDPRYRVVIVDNNSHDGSSTRAAAAFSGTVKLISSPVNLGFSWANNLALREIETKYTLFLNPDTEIIGNAIKQLVNFLDKHSDYDGVGPRIIEADGKFSMMSGKRHFTLWQGFCEAFLLDKIFPRSRLFNHRHLPEWDRRKSRDVECLTGCAMLMRTAVVHELGGFDESVPLFLDDCDLCRRMTDHGSKLYCLIEAEIRHVHNVSGSKAPNNWINHVGHMARYIYILKHYNKLTAGIYRILLGFAGFSRFLAFFGVSIIKPQYRRSLKIAWDMLTFSLVHCASDQLRVCPDNNRKIIKEGIDAHTIEEW